MRPTQLSFFDEHREVQPFAYLIVINPSGAISKYVNDLKKDFYKLYGSYKGRFSKPHITICSFLMLEQRETKVFTAFQNGLAKIDPFLLRVTGFGRFDGSNVIYLNVDQPDGLKAMRTYFEHSRKKLRMGKKYIVIKNHHLTIARGLSPEVLESASEKYLHHSMRYRNSFPVEKLTVLRYDPQQRWPKHRSLMDLRLGG